MARSVSYPSGAIVAYTTLEPITDDKDGSVRAAASTMTSPSTSPSLRLSLNGIS